jgi:hypothetical protein
MTGTTQTASGSMTVGGAGFTIDSSNLGPVEDGSARLTFDGSTNVSAVSFSSPAATGTFTALSCDIGGVCRTETPTSSVVVRDGRAFGWDYQTFGVWMRQTGPATYQAGAMSAGAVTPASAVPMTAGPVTFTGFANGIFVDPSGIAFTTSANMSAVVDFSARSVGLTTSGTEGAVVGSGNTPSAMLGLNLAGSLIYDPALNRFSGTVNSQDSSLRGSASGQFYGPSAGEIGGIYSLTPTNPLADPQNRSKMLGAFGGKR